MNSITDIIEPYAKLEREIGQLMSRLCSDTCGLCTACCCRADICEEVAESAFLKQLLRKQGRSPDQMDDRYGWLEVDGCTLDYGRPPICYAYFCDELLNRYSDEESQYLIRVLGRLLYFVGEKALGDQHLVEIRKDADLNQVHFPSLEKRLHQATAVFNVIEELIENESRLGPAERRLLSTIDLSEL